MTKDLAKSELNLQGKTLQVYLYLLRKKEPSGIREIQRDVRLSSPSVAEYQIDKLVELGIAEKDEYGRVRIARKSKARALKSHLTVGRFVFPRLVLYAVTFSVLACAYVVLSWSSLSIYGVAVPAAAAGLFWFESARSWRVFKSESPLKKKDEHFWAALAPGATAAVVFVAASVFLSSHELPPVSRYIATPPGDAPLGYVPTPPPTIDDFVQNSASKANIVNSGSLIPHPPPELIIMMALAGALAAGFLAYIMYSLRRHDRAPVLGSGHASGSPIGTQDYQSSHQLRN